MKELDQVILQKGLFTSIKGYLSLIKRHLDNQERQLGVEPPSLIDGYFWQISFVLGKMFFKKGTFNEGSNPWMLYLSKICPVCWMYLPKGYLPSI